VIEYSKFELENGLRVLIHEDNSTPMVAVNVLYDVGSRDESPEKTGFAHLFEHLMFGGSANVPDFDEPIQKAGGENNAFTNNDITNFYDVMPAENLEIALWLESDRMLSLNFDEKVLDVQRKVVVEEFKESCLNQPYGDAWHHISDMAYQKHPYRWPTIGIVPKHVEDAKMEDVKDFFFKYYGPNNAIIVISGNVKVDDTKKIIEKWFGDIPRRNTPKRNLPQEMPQNEFRAKIQKADVPVDSLYMVFHSPARADEDFYISDLLSDVLCNGPSARFYHRLVKEKQIFSQIDCYITGSIDPGLLVIEGKPADGITLEEAVDAIWKELDELKNDLIPENELIKWKNKVESTLVFSEASILNKAINLAFFELLGDANLINEEVGLYEKITRDDIRKMAQQIFKKENCSQLFYKATKSVVDN
jgi:predicted Zn-dependent peptidase